MMSVPAAEVERNFAAYHDEALRQPVSVVRDDRPPIVMISSEEYQRLKRRDRQALLVENLPDELIEAIAAAEPSPEAAR